ncbi:hypothetical protein Trydic_g20424 [Trypoxylus dichotomus]
MFYCKFCLIVLVFANVTAGNQLHIKYNRQLFRENLIPEFGGKVPEGAFNRDRLTLNRFNQNGIYSLDGGYVQQRPLVYNNKHFFYDTLKINLPFHNTRSVDTNYLVREPVKYSLLPSLVFQKFPSAPILSLNLIRSRNKKHGMWNSITPEQILNEMKPRLHPILHQDD